MSSSGDDRKARLTRAERSELRRALAEGRPITNPYLRRNALKRVNRLEKGLGISQRKRYLIFSLMTLWGIVIALSGATRRNGLDTAIGIFGASMGFALLLLNLYLQMNARRMREFRGKVSRLKRIYSYNNGND